VIRDVAPAAGIPGRDAVDRKGQGLGELPRAVEQDPASRPRLLLARERVAELRRGLRADAGNVLESTGRHGLPELGRRPRAERSAKIDGTLRRQPEKAAEADELGLDLLLELTRMCDLSRLDELAQPRFEPGSDAAELANPAVADELGHRRRQRTDELRRAAVRAHGVVRRTAQVEQRRVPLQRVRHSAVVRR